MLKIHSFLSLILCWTVMGQMTRVIDGDTFVAEMKIWPSLMTTETVRVLGVNTPELRGATKSQGLKAKAFTKDWLSQGSFSLFACKRDSFGRLLGKPYRGESVLAKELIKAGLGVRYRK